MTSGFERAFRGIFLFRLSAIFIFFFLFFTPKLATAKPIVWQAQKGGAVFTLFGSIHLGSPNFYPLPELVEDKFDKADALIVEVDLASSKVPAFPDRRNSYQSLNVKEKRLLETVAAKARVDLSLLYAMQPWQTAVTLQMEQAKSLGLRPDFGVDRHFLQKSSSTGKRIIGLESLEQQFSTLTTMEDNGKAMLLETIEDWDQKRLDLACMISAWRQGDHKTLTAMSNYFAEYSSLEDRVLYQRNLKWISLLQDKNKFPDGNYLLVVGDLHFHGKRGLLALLEKEGFSIKRLTSGGSVNCFSSAGRMNQSANTSSQRYQGEVDLASVLAQKY
ncbi:hypothetical protein A8L45_17245 [Veronia pacifica]|uniref:Polysaccharide biosynthesis protein GumN n=2 Tax=Veronia pacifica TaxID=1080227 RepID=A0A1C3EDT7_9GAMM|nr:hypothetical protein A8L45_17245 [Veronia pacifica]